MCICLIKYNCNNLENKEVLAKRSENNSIEININF